MKVRLKKFKERCEKRKEEIIEKFEEGGMKTIETILEMLEMMNDKVVDEVDMKKVMNIFFEKRHSY